MLLVIDIGNTRTKWALVDDADNLSTFEVCMNADIETSNLSVTAQKSDRALIANVAGDAIVQQVTQLLKPLAVRLMSAGVQACGVTNHYQSNLGADRWAALVGAWRHSQQATVVVNAGTAVTIDCLDNSGNFLGGTIMPGLRLMHESLNKQTAQLSLKKGSYQVFPVITQDAIETGCLTAVLGAISMMLNRLEKQNACIPKLVLSGGDVYNLALALQTDLMLNEKQVMIIENLVLQGLVQLEKEMR